jgi:hypothetical protein
LDNPPFGYSCDTSLNDEGAEPAIKTYYVMLSTPRGY